jgi:hypothetical protein
VQSEASKTLGPQLHLFKRFRPLSDPLRPRLPLTHRLGPTALTAHIFGQTQSRNDRKCYG